MKRPQKSSASEDDSPTLRKTQSHGRIGEAAVAAKCWMHGIAAYSTGGLRANFAGSDLIIDTDNPKTKKLVQVKSGYSPAKDRVYLTQCKGDSDLTGDKFVSDFVVFVNIDKKVGSSHSHDCSLGFEERIRGSHHMFRKAGVEEKIKLQRGDGEAKVYQVRQVRGIILKYQRRGEARGRNQRIRRRNSEPLY